MGQTSEGAKKAAETAKRVHGDDFHRKIGSLGGKKSRGAFSQDRKLASEAGRKGGKAKKGYKKKTEDGNPGF